jgi:hypothetical protein
VSKSLVEEIGYWCAVADYCAFGLGEAVARFLDTRLDREETAELLFDSLDDAAKIHRRISNGLESVRADLAVRLMDEAAAATLEQERKGSE